MECNRPVEHNEWINAGYSCPYCTALSKTKADRENREAELNRLADLIVEKLLSRIDPK